MNKVSGMGCRLSCDCVCQDAALDIDHTCHNLHNNTADIQVTSSASSV